MTKSLNIRQLGRYDYVPVWQSMQHFTDTRDESTTDELWFVEHNPVFTQGQAGKEEHLLATGDIPVVKVDRGGQVTYHGPGQLVCYLLIDLKKNKKGVRELVTDIENAIIATLAEFGVSAKADPCAPGVYVDGNKVASLGLRVRKGCTFHGLSLNINMDMEPFLRINPCGYAGLQMVQASNLGGPQDINTYQELLIKFLSSALNADELTYLSGLPND